MIKNINLFLSPDVSWRELLKWVPLSVQDSVRRHNEMGSLWTQLLLQFFNFAGVQVMVWRCAYVLGLFSRYFYQPFPLFRLSFFQVRYLVGATSPRVFHWSFWNCAYLFYMVCRCACGFGVILLIFLYTFSAFYASPQKVAGIYVIPLEILSVLLSISAS